MPGDGGHEREGGNAGHDEHGLVARGTEPQGAAPAVCVVESDGPGLRLRRRVQNPRPRCGGQRPARADDRLAALVAGGLRALRPVFRPHGVARRRHVPHLRRPRRQRQR